MHMEKKDKKNNPMRSIVIDKITLNIGIGHAGEELEKAKTLLERLSGGKAIETKAHGRNPVFKIKKGDPIGAKTTLRGKEALEFVKKALVVRGMKLSGRSFDKTGNFSFGVPEYIDFPGAKYDPQLAIGPSKDKIMGFDVCVTLRRKGGWRVERRRMARSCMGSSHGISKTDAQGFAEQTLGVQLV